MSKVAFLTMDVESLYETSIIQDSNIKKDHSFSCWEQTKVFTDLAEKMGCKTTLFVSTGFLPEVKDCLREAVANGHKVALHCVHHVPPMTQTPEDFEKDLIDGTKLIQDTVGTRPRGFRAPCFSMDQQRLSIVQKNGFDYDASSFNFKNIYGSGNLDLHSYEPINETVYRNNDFFEFSSSMANLFGKPYPISGGAYLRITPWFVIKPLLRHYLKTRDSWIFYVHPFEIRRGHFPKFPKLKLSGRLFLNKGRETYLKKIRKIISYAQKLGFKFTTIEDYIDKERR